MLRKRYYILFVARDEEGRVRKIPVPLRYAYGFVAAAIVGTFTIVGLAGSYTRMLLKTESYNQVRRDRETLRKDYKQMAQIAHDRDVQVASLGALASEVTALYGLRQNRLAAARHTAAAGAAVTAPAPASTTLALTNDVNQQNVKGSIDQLAALRDYALSGRISMALEDGISPSFTGGWSTMADAPTLWPVEGRVTSSFGERQDPIDGEGAFHPGIDIAAPMGTPVHATAAGVVTGADMGRGYGRTVELNDGHNIMTVYAHLSTLAVIPGQQVSRGQIIGYVGESGRSTGPHVHYEVRVDGVPVNPYKYLRSTYAQFASLDTQPPAAGAQ